MIKKKKCLINSKNINIRFCCFVSLAVVVVVFFFKIYIMWVYVVAELTEVKGHRGVVVCFTVSNEVDLVLPLLLL